MDLDFKLIKTPLFDKLVKHHIQDNEIYEILLALLGRLFFDTNERDNWQCMPYIKGAANTGKSTLIEIIESLFNKRDVGIISSNMEDKFGLESLSESKIVISPDLPEDIASILDRVSFQSMVSGEQISIAQKNKKAISKKWTAPLLFAANYLPNYNDKSGSVSRRLAIFDMGKKVNNKDTTLKARIIDNENHLILIKCIKAYNFYLQKFGNVAFQDWNKKFNITYFSDACEDFKQESDYLYMFLTAPPGSNKTKHSNIWIEYVKDSTVGLDEFKKKFITYMKFKHNKNNYKWSNTSDNAVLTDQGYIIKKISICASCNTEKTTSVKCCDDYNNKNRRRKFLILNMNIRNDNNTINRYDTDDD